MKTITIFGLFLLLSCVFPGILQAQSEAKIVRQSAAKQIEAFDLVSAAYRGRFKEWGIPAYARLDQAYRGRQATAADLVKAAVEANQLSALVLKDESYVKAVDTNLYGLVTR